MKRWKLATIIVAMALIALALTACASASQAIGRGMVSPGSSSSSSSASATSDVLENVELTQTTKQLEYSKKDVDPLTLVKCDDVDVKLTTEGTIDLSHVGEQSVTFVLTKGDAKAERALTFKIIDTHAPEISLKNAAPTLTQGDAFDVGTYIESVTDSVDGALPLMEKEPAQLEQKSSGSAASSSATAASSEAAGSGTTDSNSAAAVNASSSAEASKSATSSGTTSSSSASSSQSSAKNTTTGTQRLYESGWYTISGSVDTATPGTYSIVVTAADIHGNRTTKDIVVNINAVPVAEEQVAEATPVAAPAMSHYVLNTNTMKFHKPTCKSVNKIKEGNRQDVDATREDILNWGYSPCGNCNP